MNDVGRSGLMCMFDMNDSIPLAHEKNDCYPIANDVMFFRRPCPGAGIGDGVYYSGRETVRKIIGDRETVFFFRSTTAGDRAFCFGGSRGKVPVLPGDR